MPVCVLVVCASGFSRGPVFYGDDADDNDDDDDEFSFSVGLPLAPLAVRNSP